jgi:Asp-tRNA(Asn)/Glu-tRNA(Gln) amidotransferase A subunit family amidase
MPPKPVPFFSASGNFASGAATPRALLEQCLEALEQWEPQVGAFTVTDIPGARRAADAATQRWKAGAALSLIDGMPVGIKDIIDTDDMATQMGSALFIGHQPRFSAASAQALRDAGAAILGKTVTTEFAASEPRGTRNPWDLSRTPGGSSSGSAAAVAAGMLCGGLGTQVVGSIIRPAGFCGVHGYKPSVGGINRGGSLDYLSQSTTGTIAASLSDAWIMARSIVGLVGGDPGYPGLEGPEQPPEAQRPTRLALFRTAGWPLIAADAREALGVALRRLQAAGVEVLDADSCAEVSELETATAEAFQISMAINTWEWRWPLAGFVARDLEGLSASARHRAAEMMRMTRADYVALLGRRQAARQAHAALAARCDAMVSVTAPGAAPVGLTSTGNPVFAVPGSLLGCPVVTLPLLTSEGLPLGLQLLGPMGGDAGLFGLAAWVEGALA